MSTRNGSGSARRVAIIGAGPGGLCMAIKLREAGFSDIVILEKGSGVGGNR
jgi:cation diffusion facilitator CzcD-associated flavoprotein CzcO